MQQDYAARSGVSHLLERSTVLSLEVSSLERYTRRTDNDQRAEPGKPLPERVFVVMLRSVLFAFAFDMLTLLHPEFKGLLYFTRPCTFPCERAQCSHVTDE